MRYTIALLGLAAIAFAKEIPKDAKRAAELYDSGVMHQEIMSKKEKFWAKQSRIGAFAAEKWPELHFAQCRDGKAVPFRDQATNFYRCKNMNLHHFLSHTALGSQTGQGSSSWGWVSEDGREFAIIAQADGAAFAEVSHRSPLRLVHH
jgi:hypothetical protein